MRHVAGLVRFEGAGVRIHLRDLATNQPFVTEDGQPSAGVTADGAVFVAVGEYGLWFVPSDALTSAEAPRSAAEAWDALPARRFEELRSPRDAPQPAPPPGPRAPEPPPGPGRAITRVTHIEAPLLLDEGDAPEVAWGVVRVVGGARKVRRWVSAERLEQGILVGRYDRCGILLDTPAPTTSRVHALVMRLGADVWILDLASRNGIQRGGTPVRAEILRDVDSLSLGGDVTLTWERIRHPDA